MSALSLLWAGTVGLLTVNLALPVAAQSVPAPKWCVEILKSQPEPTPIIELFTLVQKFIPPQGEFETTTEYLDKLQAMLPALRTSMVTAFGTSRVIAVVPIGTKYEPDVGFFDIRFGSLFPTTSLRDIRPKPLVQAGYEVVAVESRRVAYGEYNAQNAFGANTTVASETREEYGVALLNLRLAQSTSWLKSNLALQMKPEEAAAIAGKLSVIVVGEVTTPGIIESSARSTPTLQHPADVTTLQKYVTLNAACGAIVARDTRKLLYQLN